jgi:hypothetical protein
METINGKTYINGKELKLIDFLDECFYQISYYATLNNKNCIVTFPKVTTSWTYSIDY